MRTSRQRFRSIGGPRAMATWLILEDDRFNFDYCHFLPWHASQCRSLHGHSSVVTVMVRGEPDAQGFVIDFGEAKQLVKETLTQQIPAHQAHHVPSQSRRN